MAMGRFDFTSEAAGRVMLDGLLSAISEALREKIMERIRPDIDAAVAAGVKMFEATIHTMADPTRMGPVVRIILDDRRAP